MAINVWNTRKTVTEIRNNSITGSDYFYYLLSNQIIILFVLYYAVSSATTNLYEVLYELVVVVVVCVIGLISCYNSNGGENGSNLINRFIVLSVPLTIKITIIYIVFAYLQFSIFSYFEIYFTQKVAGIISVAENTAVQAIYFWRMSTWLKRINLNGTT